MSAIYITPSNPCFYDVLREDAGAHETNWTISRHAKVGDRILLYICAPFSAVVAIAAVATSPQRDDDPRSEWFGHWLADMYDLRMLAAPVPRASLLARFSDWGYWKQPRNSVRVPEAYKEELMRIVK